MSDVDGDEIAEGSLEFGRVFGPPLLVLAPDGRAILGVARSVSA